MTQAEVALLVDVDVRTYRRWEGGETVPYPTHTRLLTMVLGSTPGWLLRGEEED